MASIEQRKSRAGAEHHGSSRVYNFPPRNTPLQSCSIPAVTKKNKNTQVWLLLHNYAV